MRIRRLTVAGLRGFNTERTIDLDKKLTLISAPNSYGKTSITEALEVLIYGQTSKVEAADSKDEYKDSYQNRHYRAGQPVFVEAVFSVGPSEDLVLRAESDDRGFRRFANGQPVSEWPFAAAAANAARPFVVQHSLKSLLLAAPSDRFQGFARLLGLREVDTLQQILVNLCTKPEAQIPVAANRLLSELEVFDSRLRADKNTASIGKALSKGSDHLPEAYSRLHERGLMLIGKNVSDDKLSSELVALRNAAAEKVYSGAVAIRSFSTAEQQRAGTAREGLERSIRGQGHLFDDYSRLAAGDAADRVRKEAQILGLGLELLADIPGRCPLCEQVIDESLRAHITDRHEMIRSSIDTRPDLSTLRTQLSAALKDLAMKVTVYTDLQATRSRDLIAANMPEASGKIKALFGKNNEYSLTLIALAGGAIRSSARQLEESASKVQAAIEVCTSAIQHKAEEISQIEALSYRLLEYLRSVDEYSAKLDEVAPTLTEPTQLLQKAIDAQAGTTELSLLIELLASRPNIRRAVRIREALASLKDLKKHVDQAVGRTMEEAFSSDLTGAVMTWYKRIRTIGDPDVHFSGFAMDKTKSGDFKNRRVKITAKSYGVELASAVSSLSESKLNALGLCMSIATALRAPGPWDFLVLDDPIQSWDDDHENQFIEIVRALAQEENKQVILLSHRERWIDQVVAGCRSLNGIRYHISGYTQDGPVLQLRAWATLEQRLSEVISIVSNPTASTVRLQQAEEEIRIIACELIGAVAEKRLDRTTAAHSMNKDKARSILNEAGCPPALMDRVIASFATTDPAHHTPHEYTPNVQRIRQYHGALIDLRNWNAV